MKTATKILLTFVFILSCSFLAKAQAPTAAVAADKRELIAEMIRVTKVDTQMAAMMDILLKSMEDSYNSMANSNLEKQSNLTATERKRVENEMVVKQAQLSARFREKLKASLDYKQYIEETMYPLYDKFFTAAELNDLVTFYKSPTGQKMIETMPQLLAESVKQSQTVLLPKIMKIVDDLIKEDIENLKRQSNAAPGKATK